MVQIAGGVAHIGVNGAASGSITGFGQLQLSGGVSVDGDIPADVTVTVVTAGSSAPLVAVDAGTALNVAGNVQGLGGTIVVSGKFIVGSAAQSVQPKVVVNSGATFWINPDVATTLAAVDVYAQSTLVIGANASAVYIGQITKCLGTVQINLATTAAVFISGSKAGTAVAFSYSTNNVPADLANCAVQVVDSTGAMFTLTSKTSASLGRRLLGSSGTATWGPNTMSYTLSGASAPSQASTARSYFAFLPIVGTGVLGLLA